MMNSPMVNMLPRESTTSNHPDILVSIVVPAYNAEKYISNTLKSVLAQTYRNFEVIIVDDGSIDSTADIVRDFTQIDSRFRLLKQVNAGVAAARNMGIRHAKGEFIAPLDADDIWYSHHLEKQVLCLFTSSETVALVYSWSVDIDERGRLLGGINVSSISGYVHPTLICGNFLGNASSCMVRKSVLDEIGYDVSLRERGAQGCEDWDLYLKIAREYEIRSVCTFSVGYRKFAGSMSSDYKQMALSHKLVMDAEYRNRPGLPRYLCMISKRGLYLYFAKQSLSFDRGRMSRYWIRQAMIADPILCWTSPMLYSVGLRTYLYRCQNYNTGVSGVESGLSLAHITRERWRIRQLLVRHMLFHWIISYWAKRVTVGKGPMPFYKGTD